MSSTFSKISEQIWEGTGTGAEGIIANKIEYPVPTADNLIFAFADEKKRFHIIFENREGFVRVPPISGMQGVNMVYTIRETGERKYLDLICEIPGFRRYFSEFAHDLFTEYCEIKDLNSALNRTLSKWRSFLSKKHSKLSDEEIYGLIAELLAINELSSLTGPEKVLEYWRGPLKERDFKGENWDLEVKCTLRDSHVHVINGLDQLEVTEERKLGLASYCFEKTNEETIGITLPEAAKKTEELFAAFPDKLTEYRRLLSEARYDPTDEELLNTKRFTVNDAKLFAVDNEFPRFTHENLKVHPPSRVSRINYTLDLEGVENMTLNSKTLESFIK